MASAVLCEQAGSCEDDLQQGSCRLVLKLHNQKNFTPAGGGLPISVLELSALTTFTPTEVSVREQGPEFSLCGSRTGELCELTLSG